MTRNPVYKAELFSTHITLLFSNISSPNFSVLFNSLLCIWPSSIILHRSWTRCEIPRTVTCIIFNCINIWYSHVRTLHLWPQKLILGINYKLEKAYICCMITCCVISINLKEFGVLAINKSFCSARLLNFIKIRYSVIFGILK